MYKDSMIRGNIVVQWVFSGTSGLEIFSIKLFFEVEEGWTSN